MFGVSWESDSHMTKSEDVAIYVATVTGIIRRNRTSIGLGTGSLGYLRLVDKDTSL